MSLSTNVYFPLLFGEREWGIRKMQTCVFLMGLLFPLCVHSSAPSTLQLVNLVYRHGDRSPIQIYPLDKHQLNNTPEWSDGLGWLSKLGMQQQYATGVFLRRRYDGFLSKKYINKEFSVQSSAVDRCLMSAYSNLAGLYPPTPGEVWNQDIHWQPIPVSMVPDLQDRKLSLDSNCALYNKLIDEMTHSEVVKKEEAKNKAFYKFVSKQTGVPHENISVVWSVADVLFCEKAQGLDWNSWVNDTVYAKIREINRFDIQLLYYTKEMARLKGGPLLKQFIENMNGTINGSDPEAKMFMYSAHDVTVVALLSALGLYNDQPPPYTATLIMELHKENGQYNVQIFYRNYTTNDTMDTREPVPLTLKDCDFKCPMETFLKLTKDAVPTNWTEECKTSSGDHSHRFIVNLATIIASSISLTVVGMLIVIIAITCIRRRRQESHKSYNKFFT
ncbi:testicular acid phosphatase homolog [Gigantopelta aegis]|uniref:testicular acid phosphatase homolog n=1 Tax=Gigantopelta aegis TaxID=1735272 RepID=UPI001B88A932|nr:testicular acid phosphatase homolog [Gigantopelta aegis]